jgi:uncharacterized protein YjbI with pentapeptide repeats
VDYAFLMNVPKSRDGLWQFLQDRSTDLEGADLREASLAGFPFSHFNRSMKGADLRGASLECANFSNLDLEACNFEGAELGRSCFFGTSAHKANFSRVSAIAADFSHGSYISSAFVEAGLERANFTQANLASTDLTEAELTHTILSHTNITGALLAASFQGTIVVGVDLASAKLFERAHIETLYLDTTAVEMLRAAFERGTDISTILSLLKEGEVPLPPDLAALVEKAPPLAGEAFDLLPEFRVPIEIEPGAVRSFATILNAAKDERPLQKHLEQHPSLVLACIAPNHRGWVVPQMRLGSEYVADFMACGLTSLGHEWLGIELESPAAAMFLKNGEQSETLRHAIRQIHDWRDWITNNLDYARRPRQDSGLGLRDISGEFPGLILIGRRSELDPMTMQRRRRLSKELRIEIRTYDFLLQACEHFQPGTAPLRAIDEC